MIAGEVSKTEFKKWVGVFKGKIVAINPTREQLNKLIGGDDDKEIEYTGEKDRVSTMKITFWLKVEGKDFYLPVTFTLRDEPRFNKAKTKVQYINQVGDTTWVEVDEEGRKDESKLWNSFKHFSKVTKWQLKDGSESDTYEQGAKPAQEEILGDKQYREAYVGEEKLIGFIKTWLSKLIMKNPGSGIMLDVKKLFGGNIKEISGQIGSSYSENDSLVGLAYVSVDEDDATKKYQRVWGEFLPGYMIKFINNGNFTTRAEKVYTEWKDGIEGEYGVNGFVTYDKIREYKEEEDLCASPVGNSDITEVNDQY